MNRRKWNGFVSGTTCLFLPLAILPQINDEGEISTIASWYGPGFQGRKTASGERFDQNKLTAASRTLPFGTRVNVRNLSNGRTCTVVINDRGPFVRGRGIDLSHEAARRLGIGGIARVCYSTVPQYRPAPEEIRELPESVADAAKQPESGADDRLALAGTGSEGSMQEASALNEQPAASRQQPAAFRSSLFIEPFEDINAGASVSSDTPLPLNILPKKSAQARHVARAKNAPNVAKVRKVIALRIARAAPVRKPAAVHVYRLASAGTGRAASIYRNTSDRANRQSKLSVRKQKHPYSERTYYVARAPRRDGSKLGRTVQKWSVKLAHLYRGIKGIFATL